MASSSGHPLKLSDNGSEMTVLVPKWRAAGIAGEWELEMELGSWKGSHCFGRVRLRFPA